jgi:hypothetical protein
MESNENYNELDTNLFVLYTINTKTNKYTGWHYDPLPAGWEWIGGGDTTGAGGYTREEQLRGPKKSKATALKQVTKVLTKLKADGILTRFKVRQGSKLKPGVPTTKTKKGRKSPAESASEFAEGTVKKGQDGNDWIIVKDKKGVGRWMRSTVAIQKKQSNAIKAKEVANEAAFQPGRRRTTRRKT